jgi:signal transduction histidine kinase
VRKAFGRQALDQPSGDAQNHSLVDAARQQATARLFDSLLHDARNPLNALAINLDVLAERLKTSRADAAAMVTKNITTMREQILRVDAVLRQFAEFLAPQPAVERVDFSEVVERVVRLLDYEARRSQVRVKADVEPHVRMAFGDDAHTLALLVALRGLLRARRGTQLELQLVREGAQVVLCARDGNAEPCEPLPDALPALEQLAEGCLGSIRCLPGECRITLSDDLDPREGR